MSDTLKHAVVFVISSKAIICDKKLSAFSWAESRWAFIFRPTEVRPFNNVQGCMIERCLCIR